MSQPFVFSFLLSETTLVKRDRLVPASCETSEPFQESCRFFGRHDPKDDVQNQGLRDHGASFHIQITIYNLQTQNLGRVRHDSFSGNIVVEFRHSYLNVRDEPQKSDSCRENAQQNPPQKPKAQVK